MLVEQRTILRSLCQYNGVTGLVEAPAHLIHGKQAKKAAYQLQDAGIIKMFMLNGNNYVFYAVLMRDADLFAEGGWTECHINLDGTITF